MTYVLYSGETSIIRCPRKHESNEYANYLSTMRGGGLMPIITLEMGPLSTEQKENLIIAFTRDVCEVTGMPAEAMIVLIRELSRDNMGVGGQQLSKMNTKR
jgi:4-oxalocrotonate tautomerase